MHEQSETVQQGNGKWVNVYGRDTPKAGQRLPPDKSGVGHKEYDTAGDAVKEAIQRSNSADPHEHTKPDAPAGQDRNMENY